MNKKTIALAAGGYSGESGISLQSAAMMQRYLDPARFEVYPLIITRENWYHEHESGERTGVDRNDFSLLQDGRNLHFDAVMLAIHGTPGEDGRLQGYLDMLGIPYSGCGSITSALTFNKNFCKQVVGSLAGIRMARSLHFFRGNEPKQLERIASQLRFPLFVKPAEGGSSLGISKVPDPSELEPALKKAYREDRQILVEEFVPGREFTCGVFRHQGEVRALPITEIRTGRTFFDYEAKYTPGLSEEITPADIPVPLAERISGISRQIYCYLDCRGIVRIDYILESDGRDLYFLEINTMPGQTENSIVPRMVRASGMPLEDFYQALIQEALNA